MDYDSRPKRCWINQPSTLQPLHKYHGMNVLAIPEDKDSCVIYFTSGDIISMRVYKSMQCLSKGWK